MKGRDGIMTVQTTHRKTLVIIAHPTLHTSSRINQRLAQAAANHSTTVHDLYAEYNNTTLNIEREQQLLLDHDRIIFQFPIWWYSSPSLLKQWFDDVLTYGWAYGEGGNKLHGKEWGLAVTASGSDSSYSPEGYNLFPLEQLLRPYEVTASIVGAIYIPIFSVHNAMHLNEEALEQKADEYASYLTSSFIPLQTSAL